MGGHFEWDPGALGRCCRNRARCLLIGLRNDSGQSTVEYAVVAAALIAIVVALGALSGFLRDGALIQHVIASASHAVERGVGGVVDVFCF